MVRWQPGLDSAIHICSRTTMNVKIDSGPKLPSFGEAFLMSFTNGLANIGTALAAKAIFGGGASTSIFGGGAGGAFTGGGSIFGGGYGTFDLAHTNATPVTITGQQPKADPAKKPETDPAKKPDETPKADPAKKPETDPAKKPDETPKADPAKKPEVDPAKKPNEKPVEKPEQEPTLKPEEKLKAGKALKDIFGDDGKAKGFIRGTGTRGVNSPGEPGEVKKGASTKHKDDASIGDKGKTADDYGVPRIITVSDTTLDKTNNEYTLVFDSYDADKKVFIYKYDVSLSDLSHDDKGANKGWEPKNNGIKVEVTVNNGAVAVDNRSKKALASK